MKKRLIILLLGIAMAGLVQCSSDGGASTTESAANPPASNQVVAPQFTPPDGTTFQTNVSVTMASSTAGAVICYTDDGSTTPACNAAKDGCEAGSTQYTAAVNLTDTTTLKAMACKSGMKDSTVASATYTKDTTAPTLSSTTPDDGATSVDPTSDTITLVFNENMNTSQTPSTLTTRACGDSSDTGLGSCGSLYWQTVPNSATFTWENDTTLKIQLSWVRFPENSQIQWTLAKDNLKDRAGNVLAADITRTFTTKALNSRGNGAIADTGQTRCYYCASGNNDGDCTDAGEAWTADPSCTETYAVGSFDKPAGQDAHYANKPSARNFTGPTQYNSTSDYTTTDNVTGLVWKSCTQGQSGSTCGGSASQYTWYDAVNQCAALNAGAGYAGRTNWRLPTSMELRSIANNGAVNPAIDVSPFPATVSDDYWSASTRTPDTAWVVYFGFGITGPPFGGTSKGANTIHVRCVSSSSTGGTVSYADNGDTVTHSATGLVWQQCGKGRNSDDTCSDNGAVTDTATWQAAMEYCENLDLASHTDWRLPSANELKTIVDKSRSAAPYIDASHFPSTASNSYWSSTTSLDSPDNAWLVSFSNGYLVRATKTDLTNVRCVRSGS